MEKSRMDGLRGCIFPVAVGLICGAAAVLLMMLLSALGASELKLSDRGLSLLIWVPVLFGGFAAGATGAGFAPEFKLLCGILPAMLLWVVVLLLQREYSLLELVRGGAFFLSGGAGAMAFSRKRQHFKLGKGRPGMHKARPRKGPF